MAGYTGICAIHRPQIGVVITVIEGGYFQENREADT